MANTTFKGPVRSQNGFQELVAGVWTPIGGGGGGGGVTYIPYTPGTTYYTVTGLAAPGDSASIAWQFHNTQSGSEVVITTDAIPGTDGALFVVTSVIPGATPYSSFSIMDCLVFNDGMYSGVATVTYVGTTYTMGSTFAVFVVDVTGFDV